MVTPLNISAFHLSPVKDDGRIFDMTGGCAFAICSEGDFDIRILNIEYQVKGNCIFACMPFVIIEIVRVRKDCKIIFGSIKLEDVLAVINHTVNSSNLFSIQHSPLVRISSDQFDYLNTSIEWYLKELKVVEDPESTWWHVQQEIIACHTRLIMAQVIKIYFTNIPMPVKSPTNRDMIFQHFMLDLYVNCRDHRDMEFYASRSSLSRKYFSTIVRQLSGLTPSELIETVVVGEAKSMLTEIHRSIKDIATTLNFPDAPTFTKYFQRVTGMTPKAYRKTLVPE